MPENHDWEVKTQVSIVYLQFKFDEILKDYLTQTLVFLAEIWLKKINSCLKRLSSLFYFKKVIIKKLFCMHEWFFLFHAYIILILVIDAFNMLLLSPPLIKQINIFKNNVDFYLFFYFILFSSEVGFSHPYTFLMSYSSMLFISYR